MKINSENLWNYINELSTDQKVKFKVYYDDFYKTEILWNGNNFEWDAGTFTSEAFFNPLYDFEVIEEEEAYTFLTKDKIIMGKAPKEKIEEAIKLIYKH